MVSEGTMQQLRNIKFCKYERFAPCGYMSKADDGYHMVEMSRDDVAKQNEGMERLIGTLNDVCVVESGVGLAELGSEERGNLASFFGRYGAESIVIAKKPGRILWTDDLAVAGVARSEEGVSSVWSQAVFSSLLAGGYISQEVLDEFTLRLLARGYYWTRVSSTVVLHAAKAADWLVKSEIMHPVFAQFALPSADPGSLFLLLGGLLINVWQEAPSGDAGQALLSMILDNIGEHPRGKDVIYTVLDALPVIFQHHPVDAEKARVVIAVWIENMQRSGRAIE